MDDRLDYDDFVPHAPSIPGTRLKMAHTNCDNGVDWKERLYIKREVDGTILAYCHNCQKKGSYKEKGHVINVHDLVAKERAKIEPSDEYIDAPSDSITKIKLFPSKHRAWLQQYGIDSDTLNKSIAYSPKYDRILFPMIRESLIKVLVGWQGRSLDPTEVKYITVTLPDAEDRTIYSPCGIPLINKETIVLTEDALSAMKISRYLPAMALQGVSLNDTMLVKIAKEYKNVIIFLDDDNATVRKAQLDMYKQLNIVVEGAIIIAKSDGRDPKEYPYGILEKRLKRCIRGMKNGHRVVDVSYVETDTPSSLVSGTPKEK